MLDHYGIGLMFCVCSLTCSYEHDFLRCDSRHLRCYLWKVLFRMFYLVRYALMFRVIYVPGYICSGLYMFAYYILSKSLTGELLVYLMMNVVA
jgi:hypothetical protein